MTFQFWWYYSFGDILVLVTFLLSIVYCLLSTVCCLLSTVYDILSNVYCLLTLSLFYFGCLLIPGVFPVDFDIPSQGVHPTERQTTNNTPNIEPLQILVGLDGIGKSGDRQYATISDMVLNQKSPAHWEADLPRCHEHTYSIKTLRLRDWIGPEGRSV